MTQIKGIDGNFIYENDSLLILPNTSDGTVAKAVEDVTFDVNGEATGVYVYLKAN